MVVVRAAVSGQVGLGIVAHVFYFFSVVLEAGWGGRLVVVEAGGIGDGPLVKRSLLFSTVVVIGGWGDHGGGSDGVEAFLTNNVWFGHGATGVRFRGRRAFFDALPHTTVIIHAVVGQGG